MARLTAFQGIRMDTNLSFYEADSSNIVYYDATTIVVNSPAGTTQTYTGIFTYDYYGGVSGTLTGFSEKVTNGPEIWSLLA